MTQSRNIVFETERLIIRPANTADCNFYLALWTNPEVMKHVGFPRGIPITYDEIKARLNRQGETAFDALLVIEIKTSGQVIGECKLERPNEAGFVEPDIKLLPAFWGQGYGSEAWAGIVSYEFTHTNCEGIATTPNVENIAAIKLYEAADAVCEGEGVYEFPEHMRKLTTPVHHFWYCLYRSVWEKNNH